MRKGGNDKFIEFLDKYNVPKNTPISRKYNTSAATLYKDRLVSALFVVDSSIHSNGISIVTDC